MEMVLFASLGILWGIQIVKGGVYPRAEQAMKRNPLHATASILIFYTILCLRLNQSIRIAFSLINDVYKKYKNKLVDQQQSAGFFKQEFIEKDYMDEEEIKIMSHEPRYPD